MAKVAPRTLSGFMELNPAPQVQMETIRTKAGLWSLR